MTVDHAKTIARNSKNTYGGNWRIVRHDETLWIQLVTETSRLPHEEAEVLWDTDNDETTFNK